MNRASLDMLMKRLEVHLSRDQYEPCCDLVREAERRFLDSRERQQESKDELECLANLPIERRYIELLERLGYIYVSDLDGVSIWKIEARQLGPKGRQTISKALKEAREQLSELKT